MPDPQGMPEPMEGLDDRPNDEDNAPSTIPREIFIRKRTDASIRTCKTSGTGSSSGSRNSRSSKNTRGRLRFSFLARKSIQLLGAFRSKDGGERRKRPRVADEEDNDQVIENSTDTRTAGPRDINQNRLHDDAAEASAEASPPPPSYNEALRLGLFKRPSQVEGVETTA